MNGIHRESLPINSKLSGGLAHFTPTDRAANVDAIKLPKDLEDWANDKRLTEEQNRRRWTTVPGQVSTPTGPRGLNMAGEQ